MSWKIEILDPTEDERVWISNQLRFPTRTVAVAAAMDLVRAWVSVKEWRVVTSDDPVNANMKVEL